MHKDMTRIILESNTFDFHGEFCIQKKGTTMGSHFTPNYAGIFMYYFETTHLPPCQPLIWKRYIDDIVAVFPFDTDLELFCAWLNNLDGSIKFTIESSDNGIPFLDRFVTIQDNRILTCPFTKKTDTKQYINRWSCHPPHIIHSVPYSQALHIKRICSKEEDFILELLAPRI